uniref:Uncharacterized protein n=1 Tax=Anguilla anguilla TaxID=7936 RepID=A0A0E9SDD7_ANGAN
MFSFIFQWVIKVYYYLLHWTCSELQAI